MAEEMAEKKAVEEALPVSPNIAVSNVKAIDWLSAKARWLCEWYLRLGLIILAAIVLVDTINALWLKVFNGYVITFGKELIEELGVGLVFVGMGRVTWDPGHIRTEFVAQRFPPNVRKYVDVIAFFAGFAISVMISVAIYSYAAGILESGAKKVGIVQLPLWPSAIAMVIGSFLLTLSLGLIVAGKVAKLRERTS